MPEFNENVMKGPFGGVKRAVFEEIGQHLDALQYKLLEEEKQRHALQKELEASRTQQAELQRMLEREAQSRRQLEEQFSRENARLTERLAGDDKTTMAISEKIELMDEVIRDNTKTAGEILDRMAGDDGTFQKLDHRVAKMAERMTKDDESFLALDQLVQNLSERMQAWEKEADLLREAVHSNTGKLQVLEDSGVELCARNELNMLDKRTNSQAGEDSILAYIVAVLGIPFRECTYIDLGANRPKEMSNTYFFYAQGASGVLVEADPGLIPQLQIFRSRDTILHRCVDVRSGDHIDFNIMSVEGLSTASSESVREIQSANQKVEVVKTIPVETISVTDIIENVLGVEPTILSVDIEGKEMDILESIDWDKHRPLIVITEMIPYSVKLSVDVKNEDIMRFMLRQGYKEFAFTGINSIFVDCKHIETIYKAREADER